MDQHYHVMSAKSKSKASEAQQLLDDLDSLGPPTAAAASAAGGNSKPSGKPGGGGGGGSGGEADLAFLDEITQKREDASRLPTDRPPSRAGTPTLRKTTERVKLGGGSSATSLLPSTSKAESTSSKAKAAVAAANAANSGPPTPAGDGAGGNWGWGSVWTTASAAIQQARTVVDEQVKQLPNNENVSKWGEGIVQYAKTAELDRLGESCAVTLTRSLIFYSGKDFRRVGMSILNVVAPPISEHEVIQVWLSHDMEGYEGIESLVYRSMAKVLSFADTLWTFD